MLRQQTTLVALINNMCWDSNSLRPFSKHLMLPHGTAQVLVCPRKHQSMHGNTAFKWKHQGMLGNTSPSSETLPFARKHCSLHGNLGRHSLRPNIERTTLVRVRAHKYVNKLNSLWAIVVSLTNGRVIGPTMSYAVCTRYYPPDEHFSVMCMGLMLLYAFALYLHQYSA